MKALKLNPREWDFRKVEEWQLPAAIEWEYARQSDRLRPILKRWIAELGNGEFTHLNPPPPELWHLHDLRTVIAKVRRDFPKPWLAGKNLNRKKIAKLANVLQLPAFFAYDYPGLHGQLYRRREYDFCFRLRFDQCSHEHISKAFAEWAQQAAKKFPKPPQGRAASAPWQKLRWLAALRLSDKYTYGEVHAALAPEAQLKTEARALPFFASKRSWDNALEGGLRILAQMEQPKK